MATIYTLTSSLHDEKSVALATDEFLSSLGIAYDMRGNDYTDYGTHPLDLIFVRTGGTEGIFCSLLPQLLERNPRKIYLLASGKSNSLAASMEILSLLRQRGIGGEIIHGSREYVSQRINILERAAEARSQLMGCRLGCVGLPSDWLVASRADVIKVRERMGIQLCYIAMKELLTKVAAIPSADDNAVDGEMSDNIRRAMPGAMQIYHALKSIITRDHLQGFTLRCFDLLSALHNTGCLALAKLNAEGYVAGCEGDVPAMMSMMIGRAATGVSGFQANPATIDPETGEVLFAHCTIPLDMVERYEYDTHFESGIGVAIRGFMAKGPVTVFKVSGDLGEYFAEEGELLQCGSEPGLCRTQLRVRLNDSGQAKYFLTRPIGNHHIILPGHHKALLREILG